MSHRMYDLVFFTAFLLLTIHTVLLHLRHRAFTSYADAKINYLQNALDTCTQACDSLKNAAIEYRGKWPQGQSIAEADVLRKHKGLDKPNN